MIFKISIKEKEFRQSIDISNCDLYNGDKVFIIWRWVWVEESETSTDSERCSESDTCLSTNGMSDGSNDEVTDAAPSITHSVVFKCIGTHKEAHYQDVLSLVAKIMKEGRTVPVRLQKEPQNPVDARAIAFQCKVKDKWERIGYVVQEVLEAVHDAMDNQKIVSVDFDWVKYILHFKNRGWYAGIIVTKEGQWPPKVLQCRATSFIYFC